MVGTTRASTAIPDPAAFLAQTDNARTSDHPRFMRMLAQLHREAPRLSPAEQWHLRYLDAWQTGYQGDYTKADVQLRAVAEHSGDATLAARASAMRLLGLGFTRRYEEAFALAERLATDLPNIKDPLARFQVLINLSQSMLLADKRDLALKYARMVEGKLPPGETLCSPRTLQITIRYDSPQLTSSSPEFHQAIETCRAAGQPVYVETLHLVMVEAYLREKRPSKALAFLDRIEPGIKSNGFYAHMESAAIFRAKALFALGRLAGARTAALTALSLNNPNEISEANRDIYEVLYKAEKKLGDTAATLSYFERYALQDKGYLDDVSARALAYQTVQQHLLTGKLETERLSKQNAVLRLQQALDAKAVETSRLYILLLLLLVASIASWLYRLKRSQLRFKRLSHHDGLTGIFNHQHFIGEAARLLQAMKKKTEHACLIFIDLDYFKQVNDTHGHAMGDAVLKQTVAICQQELRPADLFGRLGGEEFGILLAGCSRHLGMDIANRIRVAIGATPMGHDDCVITISASVGLASTEVSGHDLQRLCMEADMALYRAKGSGRNRVVAHAGTGDLFNESTPAPGPSLRSGATSRGVAEFE
ncbi:diguanylate cyclase [Rhodanobacter sp. Root480]|nr:diguanylate cyclase [Rhodanobacter sp. Root480]